MIKRSVFIPFVLTALLQISPWGWAGAEPPAASDPAIRRTHALLDAITTGYVDPVTETQLLLGCSKKLQTWVADNIKTASTERLFPKVPEGSLHELQKTLEQLRAQYPGVVDNGEMMDACARGMVESLDKRTVYYAPHAFRELADRSSAGLGLELAIEDNQAKVLSIVTNSPAERARVLAGDRLVAIDQMETLGRSLEEVVRALRGRPGTTVHLMLVRDVLQAPLQLNVQREVISTPSVTAKRMGGAHLYVRIGAFQNNTMKQLAAALQEIAAPHSVRGVILDLRNSPGGVLSATIAMAAAFLPPDVAIVSTKGQSKDTNVTFYARTEFYQRSQYPDLFKSLPPSVKTVPLVVLVNRFSSSGAEIVAGALQDFRRAKIIGERTMGVGTIQTIRLIDRDIALKLTSARTVRPSGGAIDGIGITPDIAVQHRAGTLPLFGSEDDGDIALALKELGNVQR